jgi:hemoglobin
MGKILVLVCLLSVVACQHTSKPSPSLYSDLGEYQGIESIVRSMIFIMAKDERVRARFKNVNLQHFKKGFSDYVCQTAGGPCQYQGESLAIVHAGHGYTHSEFNAVVEHLMAAMKEQQVPLTTLNRLLQLLAPAYSDIVYH